MRKKLKKRVGKKGVSPVIATVLLIAMVIIIGLIIFFWFRSLTKDAITKFGGVNIELVCQDVEFQAAYSSTVGALSISNIGNVPLYDMKVKIFEPGKHRTVDLKDMNVGWPSIGLRQGKSFLSGDLSYELGNAQKILVIPILIGSSQKGDQIYVCDDQYGYEL